MPESYIRKPNTECTICKKPIYRRPVEIERAKGRMFCSMACYGISCRKEIPCAECGKLILSGKNRKTCSRACANKYRKGIEYKIHNPKDIVRTQRILKARLVDARDGKCERCAYNKIEILQVHHKDRNRNNNDLSNLELICPNCHCEEHHVSRIKTGMGARVV